MRKLSSLFLALMACVTFANADGGALKGAFTINANGDQVVFAQGNLQYLPKFATWRFAEHQYDVLITGTAYVALSDSYENWMDLFGWGTSGYNEKYPYMTSRTGGDYGDGETDIAGTNYDWGVYNAGQLGNGWRSLTADEWNYIIKTRQSADNLQSEATICGISGYVLLPDDFVLPEGLSWSSKTYNYYTNIYDQEAWAKMESAGAVFLPAAGSRMGNNVYGLNTPGFVDNGHYWSATHGSKYTGSAFAAIFQGAGCAVQETSRDYGYSVRLAKDYVAPSGPTTSIDNTNANAKAVKVLRDGQLLINHNNCTYDARGRQVR